MSEISLASLAEAAKPAPARSRLPMQEINSAYKECKFGLFHIKLLAIAFTGFITGVLVSNTTSYLLPMAECDLNMSLLQKGFLNAIPYIGMLPASIIAGFLTDAFGRNIFVVIGNAGIFCFSLVASFSQSYGVLLTAKFFEGALFATAFSAIVTLTSEFCHDGIRDRVLLFQSSFGAIAQIVVPAMSWAILSNDWRYVMFEGKIVLNTWNFYLLTMSLWSLTSALLYFFLLPESPKFLITKGKFDEAREILIYIYRQNTWKPADTYPYANIWKDKVKHTLNELPETEAETSIRHQIALGLHNVKPMFQKPLAGNLALICFLNFLIMALYNILRLWFPQLSTIVEHYKKDDNQDLYNILRLWFPQLSTIVEHYKKDDDQDLCEMLDTYTQDLRMIAMNATSADVCVPTKSGAETYINSIIMGCVCLLPYFVTGLLVNRVGKKPLVIGAGLLLVGTTFGLRWSNTKPIIVALFSASTAIAQLLMSMNVALTVEIFPTTTRTLAISLMMVAGRIGTLVGNITFPLLLDLGCVIPFYSLTAMMGCVTVLTLFLPKKKQ